MVQVHPFKIIQILMYSGVIHSSENVCDVAILSESISAPDGLKRIPGHRGVRVSFSWGGGCSFKIRPTSQINR